MAARLEHANFTVTDPDATAAWMADVFGWHVRWAGDSIYNGRSVHVGTDDQYVALYAPAVPLEPKVRSYDVIGGLNHVAVVVDDIAATEAAVKRAGFTPQKHADYEPGLRFYFDDGDGIEFEVVQYD
jgi:catechol 2,3-dioxygenase-like lactoylglutathione lyase family enzyme